jgi:hypothetical protein
MKRLSALAQLIALYAEKGITGSGHLAKLTGFTERAIWKAKAELRDSSPLNNSSPPPLNNSSPLPEQEFTPSPEQEFTPEQSPSPLKERSPPAPPLKKNNPPPQPIPPHFVRSDGRATLEDSKTPPEEKNRSLPDLVAAAERAADPDEGDEGRYWAALAALAKAGLPRSQLVKLGKLIGEHDEALAVFRSVAAARVPATYLAKIVHNREQEARQESLAMAGLLDEPEWVRGYRREGYSPIYKRPDGNWEISRWTFDPEGLEIGG